MALAIASSTAALAYLDAKFHLRNDINALSSVISARRGFEKLAAENKRSFWYRFEDSVNRMPDDEPCLWSRETGELSYSTVYTQACRYANWMRDELGVRPGDLVAFYLTNSVEMVTAYLATWAIGAAPSMINYNISGSGLIHCLKIGKPKVMLVDEDMACQKRIDEVEKELAEIGMKKFVLDRIQKVKIARASSERPGDELRANVQDFDPVILLFTSGTTGFPKASKYHHSRVVAAANARVMDIGTKPGPNGTRFYAPLPYYHGTAFTTTLICLSSGMCLCIGRKFSPSTFWDDVRDSRATAFVYVGEAARYLLAQPPSPRDKDHNLTMMFGNGLRPDVWERFRQRFGVEMVSEFFNSTEGVLSLLNRQNRGTFGATAVGHHGLILRTMFRNTWLPVAIDPVTNEIVRDPKTGYATRSPYSVGGEILVRVPSEKVEESGFTGYMDNASATSKKFIRDVFEKGDCFYRSGDALRRDDDGRWFFLDRLGDTFRWKSENVSTAEVADMMGRFEGMLETNIYGVLVPGHDGRAGCAAVFLDTAVVDRMGGKKEYFKHLLAFLRRNLPRYAVPVFLREMPSLSPTHNQKQNKVPLREEGCDIEKIKNGTSPTDKMWWAKAGAEGYEEYDESGWEECKAEKARL